MTQRIRRGGNSEDFQLMFLGDVDTGGDGSAMTDGLSLAWNEDQEKFVPTALATGAALATTNTNLSNTKAAVGINVKDYGAVGDNAADDTAAINLAIAAAAGKTLVFPSSTGYRTFLPIVVPEGIDVVMDAPLVYAGSSSVTALTIGSSGANNFRRHLKLNVSRATQSDWTSEAVIGVQLINLSQSAVELVDSTGYTIAAQLHGNTLGCDTNIFTILRLHNSKICLDLKSTGSGWVTDNVFIGGNYTLDGDACNPTLSRYGVRIGGSYYNNNNVFIKPCFQLKGDSCVTLNQEVIPIDVVQGESNHFIDIRNESVNGANGSRAASPCMRVANASFSNRCSIAILNGTDTLTDTSTTQINSVTRNERVEVMTRIFDSGPVHKRGARAQANGYISVPGVHFVWSSDAVEHINDGAGCTLYEDYLEFGSSRGVAVWVNTQEVKTFVVRRDVLLSQPGNVRIACYDVNNNLMDGSSQSYVVVPTVTTTGLVWSAQFGGAYAENADATVGPHDFIFTVTSDVKRIRVMLTAARLRSFGLYASGMRDVAVWSGVCEVFPGTPIGNSAPGEGTHDLGRVVSNVAPSPNGAAGWICTTAGTFGTLAGVTGTVSSGSTLLTVNALSTLAIGQYINIVGVTGTKRITGINGSVLTLDTASDASVNGAAVSYQTPVYKYFGLIQA